MDLSSPLDQLTNDKRRFGVFAIDHRDSLRAFVRPDDPDSLTPQEITDLKDQMVRAIAPDATGVMLEPEYSIPQLIDSGAKPANIGFTAASINDTRSANNRAGQLAKGVDSFSERQAGRDDIFRNQDAVSVFDLKAAAQLEGPFDALHKHGAASKVAGKFITRNNAAHCRADDDINIAQARFHFLGQCSAELGRQFRLRKHQRLLQKDWAAAP